jgi:aryl-alcohol dehydrogenase-like predicted oxidoreductase
MKTRQLGKNGNRIGEVGLACWQFGRDFGDMPEETAISIMATAVENGVNFFDTANVYGAGRSEDLIGRFLKECSSPITVALTKMNSKKALALTGKTRRFYVKTCTR